MARTDGHRVSERTADLSRRHTVRVSPHGLVSVTGGKLTTYRKMAEDTVDAVVRRLGSKAPDGATRCPTRRLAIRGATGLDALRQPGAAARFGLDDAALATLVSRHGARRRSCSTWPAGAASCSSPSSPGSRTCASKRCGRRTRRWP